MNSRAEVRKTVLALIAVVAIIDLALWSLSTWSIEIGSVVYIVIVLAPALLMSITKNPYRAIGALFPAALFMIWQIYYINFVEITGSGSGDALTIGVIPILYGIPLSVILGFGIGSLMTDSFSDDAT